MLWCRVVCALRCGRSLALLARIGAELVVRGPTVARRAVLARADRFDDEGLFDADLDRRRAHSNRIELERVG
jgi:hypothetical protein